MDPEFTLSPGHDSLPGSADSVEVMNNDSALRVSARQLTGESHTQTSPAAVPYEVDCGRRAANTFRNEPLVSSDNPVLDFVAVLEVESSVEDETNEGVRLREKPGLENGVHYRLPGHSVGNVSRFPQEALVVISFLPGYATTSPRVLLTSNREDNILRAPLWWLVDHTQEQLLHLPLFVRVIEDVILSSSNHRVAEPTPISTASYSVEPDRANTPAVSL